ncbi:MAG: hypothetical protein H7Y60_17815 [Rhodospirillaceae bacterium]|nr:hypothetical protein [Rhodospirillales bacterium]
MDQLAKCLDTLVEGGHLSRDQAQEAFKDVRRTIGKNADWSKLTPDEKAKALDVLKARSAEAKRSADLVAVQAVMLKEIHAAALAHPDGLQSGFLAHLTKDWSGKSKTVNVEYRASTIHALLDRAALDLFERYAPTRLGFKEDVPGLHAVVREVFGEDTGDAGAKAAAKAWGDTAEKARGWFNQAGGDTGKLDTWHLPQSHDQLRILKAGGDDYAKFLDEIGAEIFDRAGNPLRGLERATVLKDVFDTVSTGGMNKVAPGAAGAGKKLANKRGEARVLHFPNAKAWLDYHQRFGTGSLYSTFAGHLKSMSQDIALLEVLGPNPAATARWMKDMADKSAPGSGRMVERTYQAITGMSEQSHGWRRYVYAAMQGTRNMLRSAQMGSATLSAITDFATVKATTEWNGLEASKVLKWYTGQINPASPADRAFARRAGLVADATLKAMSSSRVVDEDLGKGWTGRFANATFELSGLNAHTNGLRSAFQMEFTAHLAESRGKAFADLEPALKAALERGGLDQAMWDAARHGPMLSHGRTKFMDPLELASRGNRAEREAGLRLHALVLQETDMAVPVPDARARAVMAAGTKGNTIVGELWRSVAMYRSYPVTVMMTHGYRAFNAASHGGMGTKRWVYGPALFLSMSSLGAAAVQFKQMAAGKDPRDMTEAKFWGQAVAQGGGLGILGDFFGAALSRTDKDLAGTLMGTGFGLVSDIANLTGRNAMAEAEGKPSNTVGDAIGFLQRYHPGSNLWWARTAVDRAIWSQLKLAADPSFPRALARMEAKAQKDFGQRFWWKPGQTTPDRAPSPSAAFGASGQ